MCVLSGVDTEQRQYIHGSPPARCCKHQAASKRQRGSSTKADAKRCLHCTAHYRPALAVTASSVTSTQYSCYSLANADSTNTPWTARPAWPPSLLTSARAMDITTRPWCLQNAIDQLRRNGRKSSACRLVQLQWVIESSSPLYAQNTRSPALGSPTLWQISGLGGRPVETRCTNGTISV